jgi:hypothetical protein
MIVMHGERLYGKVDHVPGLFYVATRFFYLQYIPLIPIGSVLILEGTEKDGNFQGARIPFSVKSMLVAWLRTGLVIGGVCLAFAGIAVIGDQHDLSEGLGLIAAGIGMWVVMWLSYRWLRARVPRALELATFVGIPPEFVARVYANNGMIPNDDPNVPDTEYSNTLRDSP